MNNKSFMILWSVVLILAASMVPIPGVASDGSISENADSNVLSLPGVAAAVEYILSCQNGDGGFGNGIGVASGQRETCEAVMALVLTGDIDRAVKNGSTPFIYLSAHPPSSDLPNYAGALGRYVMGVVAAGGNPYDLGGTDYVTLLKAAAKEEGHNPNFFAEAYVPLGLAAAGDPGCIEAQDSIAYLKEKQGINGNWVGVDATGLVICAMMACGEDPSTESIPNAIAWLSSIQNDDGGFPADPGTASNSNSETLALMAIRASGDDPAVWAKNGLTPVDHLLRCQQDNGQIWWKPDSEGSFPIQCTAYGSIALSEGWLPTAIYDVESSSSGGVSEEALSIMSTSEPLPGLAEAIGYVLSCQNPDGGFADQPGGESNLKWTVDVAVALAQTGDLDRATKGDLLGYLVANAPDESISSGNLGRYVMGVVAANGNPHDVNGIDYVDRLKNAEPINQLFADSLILMGLTAAGDPNCQEAQELVTTFLNSQADNGGWGWAPGSSDVDTTGMIVSALVKSGVDQSSQPIQDALIYLRGVQDDATGGFSMGSAMVTSPNANSCGLAIMGINAGGDNPVNWVTSSGKNPFDFMLTCQQDNGVFWWKPDAAGSFLVEGTAYGAIGMDGGFMPTVIREPTA